MGLGLTAPKATALAPQQEQREENGRAESRTGPFGVATSQPAIVRNKVDDEWEKYTRDFVRRYELNKDQSAAAWRVLKSCQEQRTAYLRSRRDQIAHLEAKLRAPKSDDDREKLPRQLEELKKPIQQIFEERLKPKLDRLPTRAQREAAKERQGSKTQKNGQP